MSNLRSPQALARDIRVGRLARCLSIHPAQAIGHLHFLWWWAIDGAPDGDLSRLTTAEVAEAAHWNGDPDCFVDSLVASGWMELGQLLSSWAELGGKTLKQREQARERQARRRERLRSRAENGHADITPASRVTSRVTSLSDKDQTDKKTKDGSDLRSEDEGGGECKERQEMNPPPAGFPQTVEEARSSAVRMGLPDGVAARVWQHVARQSFKDRVGRPVRSWEAYLKRCCAVERECRRRESFTGDWDGQRVPKGLEGVHIIKC